MPGGHRRLAALLVAACWAVGVPAGLAAQRTSAPADFARRVVTVAVDMPVAGVAFRVEPAPGATLIGEATGILGSRRLHLSFHLSEQVPSGRHLVATVRAGGMDVPVLVEVSEARRLVVVLPARLVLREARRDSVVAVVVNRGNLRERVELSARSGPGVSVSTARVIELGAGDSARVVVGIRAGRGSMPGSLYVEARAGDVIARRTAVYEVEGGARSLPVAVQAVGGEDGMRVSGRAEGRWNDSVEFRLNVGQRPPIGMGSLLWPAEARGLWVDAPAWSVALGEVRRQGGPLDPAISGSGADARWGRPGGWQVNGTVARPNHPFGSNAADAGFWIERVLGHARVSLGGASTNGWWGDRLSVLSVGVRSTGVTQVAGWSAGGGVAYGGGVLYPVGILSGRLAHGAARVQGEVARTASNRFGGIRLAETGAVRAEIGGGPFSVFAGGSVRREEGSGDVRDSESALFGMRLRRGGVAVELHGGWRGSDGFSSVSDWSAAVAGASLRFPVGRSYRVSVSREQWWAGGSAREQTTANLEWVAGQGTAWLQASHGVAPSPHADASQGLRVGAGGRFQAERWSAAFTASLDEFQGRWRGSGHGELAVRVRSATELLFGFRQLEWTNRGPEVHVGVRQRLGLPLPQRRVVSAREKIGALVVRLVFAESRPGAVEIAPRGSVRLFLPNGGTIEAPVDTEGLAAFPSLPVGRYAVEHVPPGDAGYRVAAGQREAWVTGAGETELQMAAAYLPRAMTVVRLDSVGTGEPGSSGGVPLPAGGPGAGAALNGRGCVSGTVVPGMVETEVVCILGRPAVRREAGNWTYLFYAGACAARAVCGYDDVVFLRDSRVVTAYLRGRGRRYVGPSPPGALGATAPK